MTDQENLRTDKQAVDISAAESQYEIQCEDIRLVSSVFRPLNAEDEDIKESGFHFKVRGFVQTNEAYSYLESQVVYVSETETDEVKGYFLRFGLVARFVANQEIETAVLDDFLKLYTLSIVWPYAREYASDQLRRSGEKAATLPIINPQVVTEQLIENKLVEIIHVDAND